MGALRTAPLGVSGADRRPVVALAGRRRAPVRRPEGEHGRRDDGRHDGGGDGPRAQPLAAGGAVLGVHGEAAPAEARSGGTGTRGVRHRAVRRRPRRLDERQDGGRSGCQRGRAGPGGPRGRGRTGPGPRRLGALGGAAAARAVVHVPHQFAPERGREQHLVVAGEPGDGGTVARLHDGERGPGALDLAGGGVEQFAGRQRLHGQDGGDIARAEPVAYGQFERFALLGRRTGGLGPGQHGEFTPSAGGDLRRDIAPRTDSGLRARLAAPGVRPRAAAAPLAEPAQTGPPGERVQPGPALAVARRATPVLALGDGQDLAQHLGRGVVVAQHGQAVGEQPVQIRLVPHGRPVRPRLRSGRATGRTVCAGGVGGGSSLLLVTRRR